MGYEPEDLPWEVPLIELGLDSLMAVRIKNRVEYDFDLPPIQLTGRPRRQPLRRREAHRVRDRASRRGRRSCAEFQKTPDRRGDRRGSGRTDGRGDHRRRARGQARRGTAQPRRRLAGGRCAPPSADRPRRRSCGASDTLPPTIPPPPTNPPGRCRRGDEPDRRRRPPPAAAAAVLNQQAVAEALNSDVPPRDAAERVTFATWAIVTGKSPGGIFNALPDAGRRGRRRRWRSGCRSAPRAPSPPSDVKGAPTIEELATTVREFLESGELDGFVRTIRARPEGPTTRCRCTCSTPPAARRWSTSRC